MTDLPPALIAMAPIFSAVIAPAPIDLALLAPLLAALAAFAAPRAAVGLGLAAGAVTLAAVAALAAQVAAEGPVTRPLGGWGAPLGVDLHADGLSALMLAITAAVALSVAISAARTGTAGGGARFAPLWLLLLAGLNALFLSADVFNLYVALEITALAAVGLAVAGGGRTSVEAGLRYLMASLLGSLLFLFGVGLLYAAHGRLDLAGLTEAVGPSALATAALAALLIGLGLKSALFPLHFWLPAAHANASAPASALLSALVLKGSLYVAARLFAEVFEPAAAVGPLIGAMGAAAVLVGSVRALRAERLKLLVAWSSVAQIGLIAVAFALAGTAGAALGWQAAVLLILGHALAKAAMFLAAGRIARAAGHDRLADLDRAALRPGAAAMAFGIAGASLIGLPPSGGFAGKWLLIEGALRGGGWVWAAVALAGTGLTAAYVARALAVFLRADRPALPAEGPAPAPARADPMPLLLALAAAGTGFLTLPILDLLGAGAPLGV